MRTLPPDWFLRVRLKMRHMQLLVALDEHRNVHRAASELNMSQPAASKLLGELEALLGVTLFERLPRGVAPNWYGEILIRHSHTMLAELRNAGEELTALHAGNGGRASVGTVAPAITLISSAIDLVHRRRADLQFSVDLDVSHVLVHALMEGIYDFVLARLPEDRAPDPFCYEALGSESLCFVCRRDHPLVDRDEVTLTDMLPYTWVLEPHDGLLRQTVNALLRDHGAGSPRQIVDTRSVLVSMSLVGRSDMITVISEEVAELLFDMRHFHRLPFREPVTVKAFGLISLADRRLSPGARVLAEALRETARGDGLAL